MPVKTDARLTDRTRRFFTSLEDLDQWVPMGDSSVLPFHARNEGQTTSKGSLLVCHDYKGGYTEQAFERSYTFNFWSFCNIFI